MACHEYSMPCRVRICVGKMDLDKFQKYMPIICQEYMLFFSLPAPLSLCAEEVEPWLNTQWQTENKHILLAADGHICLTFVQNPHPPPNKKRKRKKNPDT